MPAKYILNKHIKDITEDQKDLIVQSMIEFAKMHVKAALQEAAKNAIAKDDPMDYGTGEIWVDKKSILNSYPIENIK